jgi:hypothetical protein
MNIKILRRVRRSMTHGIEPRDGTSRTNATVAEPTNTERARVDGVTTQQWDRDRSRQGATVDGPQ